MQMALILLGIGLALYPWISNYIYDKSASSKIGVYEQKANRYPKRNIRDCSGKPDYIISSLQEPKLYLPIRSRMR